MADWNKDGDAVRAALASAADGIHRNSDDFTPDQIHDLGYSPPTPPLPFTGGLKAVQDWQRQCQQIEVDEQERRRAAVRASRGDAAQEPGAEQQEQSDLLATVTGG